MLAAAGPIAIGGPPSYGYRIRAASGAIRVGGTVAEGRLLKPGHIAIDFSRAYGFHRRKSRATPGPVVIQRVAVNIRVSKGILRPTPGDIAIGAGWARGKLILSGIFPALIPTKRRFTPPKYYITETVTESGVKESRLWCASPSRAILDLTFENINTTEGEAILAVHSKVFNTLFNVQLPDSIFTGYDPDLALFIQDQGANARWSFKTAPKVDIGTYPDTCTVSVILHAHVTRIIGASADPGPGGPII